MKAADSGSIAEIAIHAIEELKGRDIRRIDVSALTDVMDELVIASGTSSRHVRSIADNVLQEARQAGVRPIGVEGQETGEWVLVDFGGVVVHVMGEEQRRFYALEKLWSVSPVAG